MNKFVSNNPPTTSLIGSAQLSLSLPVPRTRGARRSVGFAFLNQKTSGSTIFLFDGRLSLYLTGNAIDVWEVRYSLASPGDLPCLINTTNVPTSFPPFMLLQSISGESVPADSVFVSLKYSQTLVLLPNYTNVDFDEVRIEGKYTCADDPLAVISVRNCG